MSQMGNRQRRYPLDGRREIGRSYLLRCWQEQGTGEHTWRFMIQRLGGGQVRKVFTSPQDLAAYLDKDLEGMKIDPPLLT
jgi:hypothetical protein